MEMKQAIKYIDPKTYKKPVFINKNEVHFWRQYETNGEFSNFFDQPFTLKGKSWPTTEHYFQAQKFSGTEKEEQIRLLQTPGETFKIGRSRDPNYPLRADWEQVKEQVMEECCYAKFTQNEYLKQFLLNTKDAKIIEASPRDAYWGWGPDKTGKNRLGIILMQLREKIRKYSPTLTENNEVHFWGEQNENGQLSNFYPAKFILKDVEWPTTEHYFQAQKYAGTEKEEQVRQLKTAAEAFRFVRKKENQDDRRKDWQEVKEKIMFEACLAKFTQNIHLQQFLLGSGNAKLIETSPKDDYWGWGPNKNGKNRLGFILQQVREEIQKQNPQQQQNQYMQPIQESQQE